MAQTGFKKIDYTADSSPAAGDISLFYQSVEAQILQSSKLRNLRRTGYNN